MFTIQLNVVEEIIKPEQSDESKRTGTETRIRKSFDFRKISETFGVSEEKIKLSGKRLPPGWDRQKEFGRKADIPQEFWTKLAAFKPKKGKVLADPASALLPLYEELKALDGIGTNAECVLIRYARCYFRR